MGTQELDWIAVANHLLSKCHVNLQVRDVTHCDARVFLALYQAILGEKVPDIIAPSHGQEDDAHNVQSVIDSLALDYLQVSLSHITGENIVRGDAESIRNLLEIFDGLLEYLTEQISEASSQNEDDAGHQALRDQYEGRKEALPALRPPPSPGSSEPITPSWEVDGSESTSELIRLGETAHTFTQRGLDIEGLGGKKEQTVTSEAGASTGALRSVTPPPSAERSAHRGLAVNGSSFHNEEMPSAIPLRPPNQPKDTQVSDSSHGSAGSPARSRDHVTTARSQDHVTTARSPDHVTTARGAAEMSGASAEDVPRERSPQSSHVTSPERRSPNHAGHAPSAEVSQKKVVFRTQPDIHFMSLQRTQEEQSDWMNGESDPPLHSPFSLPESRTSDLCVADEPLSVHRARNMLSEMELQEMSDKLSRRLDQLDQMLKKALGDPTQNSESKEEDKLSQHSDSIMEFRRKKRLQAAQNHKKPLSRPRSLSSSPVPLPAPPRLPCAQFEDALHKEDRGATGKIRREVQKELGLQRLKAQMLSTAYREELRDLEKTERLKLSRMREDLKHKDEEYKENLSGEAEKRSHPGSVYSRPPPRPRNWTPACHKAAGRMKIKENDLLPLLLEEFPHLYISPQTYSAMWRGQLTRGEQLVRSGQEEERSERKLQRELEETDKKHELLTDIIRREQSHSQRLKDFKERIRLQKKSENKMRENRQQAARAKKYYQDYHVQLRAKLMRAKTREERIMKNLFEEGLEIQKQRLQDLRSYTKEQRQEQGRRHRDQLESMENYYKDQFSMLAEAVSQERQEIQAQEKAQTKNLQKVKRELRVKMEKEIQDLQEMIVRADEDTFFRELEAERMKKRLEMASFQYGKSHCL
ncbi:centrosomal protein of 95 kDa [Mantella aurantiaca]